MQSTVTLRSVLDSDLPVFFEQQNDPAAHEMAASQLRDRDTFMAHWKEIRAKETITIMTILHDEQIAGYILSFAIDGRPEVGYWLGREYWGKGIASNALTQFLSMERRRPLYGLTAKHNLGSQRVLQKCGFEPDGEDGVFQILVLK